MSESICSDRPLQASCSLAQEKLLNNAKFHLGGNSKLVAALLALSFTRDSHREIAQNIDCDGTGRTGGSQIVCPLETAVMNARSFAEGPTQQQMSHTNYGLPAAVVETHNTPNGNYL